MIKRTDPPASFSDVFGAAWKADTIRTDAWEYARRQRDALGQTMFEMLPEDARKRIADRMFYSYDSPGIDFSRMVVDEAAGLAASDPARWSGMPLDAAQLDNYLLEKRRSDLDEAQRVLDLPGGVVAEFMGGAARSLTDEFNVALMPFGGSGSAVRMIAQEALIGGVSEALSLPREYDVADDLDTTPPDALSRIASGALLSGAFAGVIHAATRFVVTRATRRQVTRDMAPSGVRTQDHEADVAAMTSRLADDQAAGAGLSDVKQGAADGGVLSLSDFDFSTKGNASPVDNRIGYVFGRLVERGWEPEDAAAFVGNFMVESTTGLHPAIVGDGGNALGIAQWNGPRRRALEAFAGERGVSPDDLDAQIDVLFFELDGSEASAWARIKAARTVEEKAALVSHLFERPGIPHLDLRVAHARDVYDQFRGGSVPKWLGRVAALPPGAVYPDRAGRATGGVVDGGSQAPGSHPRAEYQTIPSPVGHTAARDGRFAPRSAAGAEAQVPTPDLQGRPFELHGPPRTDTSIVAASGLTGAPIEGLGAAITRSAEFAAARELDPVAFRALDDSQVRIASYRSWLADMGTAQDVEVAAIAQHLDEREAQVRQSLRTTTVGGKRGLNEELKRIARARADLPAISGRVETPDMARVRQSLIEELRRADEVRPRITAALERVRSGDLSQLDPLPVLPETAFAKGADSPEAVAADRIAAEDLRADGRDTLVRETSMPDLSAVKQQDWVETLAVDQPYDTLDEAYAAAARSEFGDLAIRLDDGSSVSAADLLDDIEADENLADVLSLCNPGGKT